MEVPNSREHDKAAIGRERDRGAFMEIAEVEAGAEALKKGNLMIKGSIESKNNVILARVWACSSRLLVQGETTEFVETNNEEIKLFMAYCDTNE